MSIRFSVPGFRRLTTLAMIFMFSASVQARIGPTEDGPVDDGPVDDGPIAHEPGPSAHGRYEILLLGNSHSAVNGLPALLSTMIEQGQNLADVPWELAPGYKFLEDRLFDGVTRPLMASREWTHVILQAQKYSSSGIFDYPTDAAEEFIRLAKAQGAKPVMFPEWPRRGNHEEGPRVHQLHLDIASREAACVAPVGLAWEASMDSRPALELHSADGNHSNLNGAVLTAYVLFEVITGTRADSLPDIPSLGVAPDIQQHLRSTSSAVVASEAFGCLSVAPGNDRGIPTLSWSGLTLLILAVTTLASRAMRRSHTFS